ncbi:MAG: hypothetical protein PHH93_02890 [Prolixibacteraceae bacterium]|nr:hypothetical protein [Prolixibacteraceae bacterium]
MSDKITTEITELRVTVENHTGLEDWNFRGKNMGRIYELRIG